MGRPKKPQNDAFAKSSDPKFDTQIHVGQSRNDPVAEKTFLDAAWTRMQIKEKDANHPLAIESEYETIVRAYYTGLQTMKEGGIKIPESTEGYKWKYYVEKYGSNNPYNIAVHLADARVKTEEFYDALRDLSKIAPETIYVGKAFEDAIPVRSKRKV